MPSCSTKCSTKSSKTLNTLSAARPRQHWGLTISPSPTTRPPRMRLGDVVRVVGLGDFCSLRLAGAGNDQLVVQTERRGSQQIQTPGLDGDRRSWEWEL